MKSLVGLVWSVLLLQACGGATPGKTECRSCAVAYEELADARQEVKRLSRDLAEIEDKLVDLARRAKRGEEWSGPCLRTDLAPRRRIQGSVTVIGDFVTVNLGQGQGVLEGDEFTIYRGDEFVAKIQVERVERLWSSGRVVLKKDDPRIGDSASNDILDVAPQTHRREPQ